VVDGELWNEAYAELRALAAQRIARLAPGRSLHPTLLVNEVFLRLHGADAPRFAGRTHFLAVVARAMRFAVVDYVRHTMRQKRGGGHSPVPVSQIGLGRPDRAFEILELEQALGRLEAHSLRAAEVVTLRFFAGLTTAEIAQELAVSTATVERDWRFARAWLHRELSAGRDGADDG
jgi:RNA polymerase sigma factor (TIGR02999 family)